MCFPGGEGELNADLAKVLCLVLYSTNENIFAKRNMRFFSLVPPYRTDSLDKRFVLKGAWTSVISMFDRCTVLLKTFNATHKDGGYSVLSLEMAREYT
jgi:hypothetical protein